MYATSFVLFVNNSDEELAVLKKKLKRLLLCEGFVIMLGLIFVYLPIYVADITLWETSL